MWPGAHVTLQAAMFGRLTMSFDLHGSQWSSQTAGIGLPGGPHVLQPCIVTGYLLCGVFEAKILLHEVTSCQKSLTVEPPSLCVQAFFNWRG